LTMAMTEKDVILAKIGNIQRCLSRIEEVTGHDPGKLENIDIQDIFVLNLQRAIQSAIDLAAHVVAAENLGIPVTIRDNFLLLRDKRIITRALAESMSAMVGFRNIAVHEYEKIKVEVLKSILTKRLNDLEEFYRAILKHYNHRDASEDGYGRQETDKEEREKFGI